MPGMKQLANRTRERRSKRRASIVVRPFSKSTARNAGLSPKKLIARCSGPFPCRNWKEYQYIAKIQGPRS